eukprot:7171476-Pyramimonas_sp.AAC.1
MRELQFIASTPDWVAVPGLLLGSAMHGWAPPVPGMLPRTKQPTCTVQEFRGGRDPRNAKILRKICPSGDAVLDMKARRKSKDELARGVLSGP